MNPVLVALTPAIVISSLLDFVESPYCIEAVLEYFRADENTKSEEILEKASRLLDGLIFGMTVLLT